MHIGMYREVKCDIKSSFSILAPTLIATQGKLEVTENLMAKSQKLIAIFTAEVKEFCAESF
jgi:hypothetical protein